VTDLAKGIDAEGNGQNMISKMTTEINAIKMFYIRLKILKDYVYGIRNGQIEPNYEVLRKVNAFMARLSRTREQNLQRLLDDQDLSVLSSGLVAVVSRGSELRVDLEKKRQILGASVRTN
jgi:hypothetical protein